MPTLLRLSLHLNNLLPEHSERSERAMICSISSQNPNTEVAYIYAVVRWTLGLRLLVWLTTRWPQEHKFTYNHMQTTSYRIGVIYPRKYWSVLPVITPLNRKSLRRKFTSLNRQTIFPRTCVIISHFTTVTRKVEHKQTKAENIRC